MGEPYNDSRREPPHGKAYKTYEEQVELLRSRGMVVDDSDQAMKVLRSVNYYRLSGYWYAFREFKPGRSDREDTFRAGTTFRDVMALYEFDARLRTAVFACLAPIELSMRALLGHELGKINPHVHLRPDLMGPTAREPGSTKPSHKYKTWRNKYNNELDHSQEDFVKHHRDHYGGQLPIWAAVEILDWGKMTYLYGMSPDAARSTISSEVDLTAAQLESWLKSLNIVRNYAAHHGRLFNRVYALKPKLPRVGPRVDFSYLEAVKNRLFTQLVLIQFLLTSLNVGNIDIIPEVMRTYPDIEMMPISRMGAFDGWESHPLFK